MNAYERTCQLMPPSSERLSISNSSSVINLTKVRIDSIPSSVSTHPHHPQPAECLTTQEARSQRSRVCVVSDGECRSHQRSSLCAPVAFGENVGSPCTERVNVSFASLIYEPFTFTMPVDPQRRLPRLRLPTPLHQPRTPSTPNTGNATTTVFTSGNGCHASCISVSSFLFLGSGLKTNGWFRRRIAVCQSGTWLRRCVQLAPRMRMSTGAGWFVEDVGVGVIVEVWEGWARAG